MSLIESTATQLLTQLEAGELSSVEITRALLDQIERHDGRIGAFLHVDAESALARAQEIDRRRQAEQPVGRLGGLPVAVKDVLCTAGSRARPYRKDPSGRRTASQPVRGF